jgi:hypothetical protein
MIAKIINFPVKPNPQMLRSCVNPDGCNRRVSNLTEMDGTMFEMCLCPAWGVNEDGTKLIFACGYTFTYNEPLDKVKQ